MKRAGRRKKNVRFGGRWCVVDSRTATRTVEFNEQGMNGRPGEEEMVAGRRRSSYPMYATRATRKSKRRRMPTPKRRKLLRCSPDKIYRRSKRKRTGPGLGIFDLLSHRDIESLTRRSGSNWTHISAVHIIRAGVRGSLRAHDVLPSRGREQSAAAEQ
jgi:hypothetical protein